MTWIASSVQKSVSLNVPLERAFAFLVDVEKSGKLWDGIEKIEKTGDNRYRWVLTERSTAGLKFKGDYVCQYANNGKDEITWSYVSGNMKSSGRYRLTASGSTVTLNMSIDSEADAPIPSLMKAVAKPFAQSELNKGVDSFVVNLRRTLEAAA
jgi:carbon monoxide dehydrogenase subunit G